MITQLEFNQHCRRVMGLDDDPPPFPSQYDPATRVEQLIHVVDKLVHRDKDRGGVYGSRLRLYILNGIENGRPLAHTFYHFVESTINEH